MTIHALKSIIGVHFGFDNKLLVIIIPMQTWEEQMQIPKYVMSADRRKNSMKTRHCKEKVVVFTLSIILVLGMAACSFNTSGGADQESTAGPVITINTTQEPATPKPETSTIQATETPQTEIGKPETPAPEDKGNEYSDAEEIDVGDPIVGIVDKFVDYIIVIKDADDPDLLYYFSTKNAQIVEGDSPIAVGDRVAISYRGVMGDEEHPGEAVKIVAESMMYQ